MTTMLQHIQPDSLFPSERLGFTQVVTAAPGRLVFVSGQTACDQKGRPIGGDDVAAQAGAALENLGAALAAAGAGPGDVTMLRLYIVGYTAAIAPAVGARVAQFFSGVKPPASTWVGVQALFHPDFLVEIEAMAVVPDRK
jgi:enamine deaminase RidA (YjgF/YER057c/UK114 family)